MCGRHPDCSELSKDDAPGVDKVFTGERTWAKPDQTIARPPQIKSFELIEA